jgi:hypothetical protein
VIFCGQRYDQRLAKVGLELVDAIRRDDVKIRLTSQDVSVSEGVPGSCDGGLVCNKTVDAV